MGIASNASAVDGKPEVAEAVRAVYDEIAEEYDGRVLGESPFDSTFSATERAFLLERVASGDAVLDLGCGTGRITLQLAEHGARVTGFDLSPGMLEVAQGKLAAAGATAELVQGDMRALPFDDGTFDAVTSTLALMHISPGDRQRVFDEIARVLRPGGRLAIGVKNALIEQILPVDRVATVDITDIPRQELVFTETRGGATLRAQWHSFSPQDLARLLATAGMQMTALTGNIPLTAWLADEVLRAPGVRAVVQGLESILAGVPPFNHFGYHLLVEATKPSRTSD